MPKLPVVSGLELVKALVEKKEYKVVRQRGSYVILTHATLPPLTVPLHREIRKGLLNDILKTAGLKPDEL